MAPPRLLLEVAATPAVLYLGVDHVASTTEELRALGVTIESEPHVIHQDDTGLFGPPGEAEEMAFFRDSEDNLVGLAARRCLSQPAPEACDVALVGAAG